MWQTARMEIVRPMLQFANQLKAFHWFTESFSEHKAFGKAYDEISDLIDTFVETYFGRYGREEINAVPIGVKTLVDEQTVDEAITAFKGYLEAFPDDLGTDLLAQRDDILGEVDHLLYMLSLA